MVIVYKWGLGLPKEETKQSHKRSLPILLSSSRVSSILEEIEETIRKRKHHKGFQSKVSPNLVLISLFRKNFVRNLIWEIRPFRIKGELMKLNIGFLCFRLLKVSGVLNFKNCQRIPGKEIFPQIALVDFCVIWCYMLIIEVVRMFKRWGKVEFDVLVL